MIAEHAHPECLRQRELRFRKMISQKVGVSKLVPESSLYPGSRDDLAGKNRGPVQPNGLLEINFAGYAGSLPDTERVATLQNQRLNPANRLRSRVKVPHSAVNGRTSNFCLDLCFAKSVAFGKPDHFVVLTQSLPKFVGSEVAIPDSE